MRLSKSPTASPAPGNGVALEVPEGGFVWAINKGNDWPALIESAVGNEWYYDDAHKAMPDYTSVACDTMITDVRSWAGRRPDPLHGHRSGGADGPDGHARAGLVRAGLRLHRHHGNLPTDSDR